MDSLGQMIDDLYELKMQRDGVKESLKELEQRIDQLEFNVLKEMEKSGVDKTSTSKATASRKVELYPQVEDINALVTWAYENNRADILQRRVSKGVFDEIYTETSSYPDGINTYNKETLNFRKRG